MIPVTKPFLPPIDQYQDYIAQIWDRNWLTNSGPLLNDFELKVKEYLDQDHFLYVGNGTLALQIAIKALDLKGEIITTPFTYIATTSSIVWEGCTPVFVDISDKDFNLDVSLVEDKITENTQAILATHVFGNPCDVVKIQAIAKRYNLKVIYDAAHCFGSKFEGKSLYSYGDISTASFHATKLFHTVEGGGIFSNDSELIRTASFMRNFGHNGPELFEGVGINAKNSELHSAMGLANLPYVDEIISKRRADIAIYKEMLSTSKRKLSYPIPLKGTDSNCSYFAVLFDSEETLLKVKNYLEQNLVFPRRYFYPLLSNLDYLDSDYELPVATSVSKRILCLPLYFQISSEEIELVSRLILRVMNN